IAPVGVGARSPSPTGVVGLTHTPPAASTSRSAASFVRLYGTASSQAGGESASVAGRPGTGPQVAHELVASRRPTPAVRQASITFAVPRTLTASSSRAGARKL